MLAGVSGGRLVEVLGHSKEVSPPSPTGGDQDPVRPRRDCSWCNDPTLYTLEAGAGQRTEQSSGEITLTGESAPTQQQFKCFQKTVKLMYARNLWNLCRLAAHQIESVLYCCAAS